MYHWHTESKVMLISVKGGKGKCCPDEHAWNKIGIWSSHSMEILLLEGKLCNFEWKFII